MSQIKEIACKFVFVELSLNILSRNFVIFNGKYIFFRFVFVELSLKILNVNFIVLSGNKFVSCHCVSRRKKD